MICEDMVGKTETSYGLVPENALTDLQRSIALMDDIQWLLNCGMETEVLGYLGDPGYEENISALATDLREQRNRDEFEAFTELDEDGNYPEEESE